ncbi:MAG: excinuclease ABC subunit UvrB [Flavobacteriaceae bacterium]|jgi:excinuclease ABC subunit B|nr:excinuclease ABC subunit UvrB [Flavobacteriaceae bacterium]MBT4112359.1 excinuclease ABC subunit UvrB [Flavobacteriaceae bacterium]MBT4614213.1 excinuclease ABC subunit UvrB [Flavobacteriaceae bacterium]MBT5246666.1 excinuclease ABC subunit UvrB [Flavobacteriaceae bacterium]MBT7403405.1 excinuclease ABC subunit UvrB [Flavobacteriaceae bacterium]
MRFKLKSDFSPTGDQPEAIDQLVKGIESNEKFQTLLGVTGSGKTYTVANVIERTQKPTLVLAHNKTLAAQLYAEFKYFFPDNLVEYFVSYYDYYQPEAYIPSSGIYIEKDLSINDEIEKLRLSTTSSLLSERKDVIVVASVSCIYGMGNPEQFKENIITVDINTNITRTILLNKLVQSLYSRDNDGFKQGNFRIKGDTIDVFPAYADFGYKIHFFGDEIEEIESFNTNTNEILNSHKSIEIYPANIFVTSPNVINDAIKQIQEDLIKQYNYFNDCGKILDAKRLKERTEFDLEMMQELGYCSGIENYSRYFDGRKPGKRPFCLIDYFQNDFLTIIDESHVTIPQVRAMYGGDRSRKENLVDYGFRLPAALDNRPLKFEEFENLQKNIIFVSATPADYELSKCEGIYTEQIIRPTGLLDPIITVKPIKNQIDDLINEIHTRINKKEKILVTTLTKKMSEELTNFFSKLNIKCKYIHSDVDTLDRVEIIQGLREDKFDVLIGVNLLREGLDLPEVSLVAILDADKEGFLRSSRSLTQTIGRAARHINGSAILYADNITGSMEKTINETNYRRKKQNSYNKKYKIKPKAITRKIKNPLSRKLLINDDTFLNINSKEFNLPLKNSDIEKEIRKTRKKMEIAAKELDFIIAAKYRDDIKKLKKMLQSKT